MTTAIIIAAGDGARWKNYLGEPKPLIKIEGETLIGRTARLIKKYSDAKIYVVGHNERYKIDGTELFVPTKNYKNYGVDKFINSKELWNKKGRTIVFYGDVWFSEEAMKSIFSFKKREWTLFGRAIKSIFTGCKWAECFAQSFYPEHIEKHLSNLYKVVKERNNKLGGWAHYRAMVGLPMTDEVGLNGHFFEIDDFTDDFDFPEDYDKWISSRKRLNKTI